MPPPTMQMSTVASRARGSNVGRAIGPIQRGVASPEWPKSGSVMRLFPAFPTEVVLGRGAGLADRAAGDALGVGIGGRLAFVGAGVDDEAGAARLAERIGTALQRDERGAQRALVGAVLADRDVREVAGVGPLRI